MFGMKKDSSPSGWPGVPGSSGSATDHDLMCRNGCGFYGNPEWQWLCSKCWRQKNTSKSTSPRHTSSKSRSRLSPTKSSSSASTSTAASSSPAKSSSFSKFDSADKKRHRQFLDRTQSSTSAKIERIFRKGGKDHQSPSSENRRKHPAAGSHHHQQHHGPPAHAQQQEFPPESKAVSAEFATFLDKRLERPGVADISRQMKALIDRIVAADSNPASNVEQVSAMVQEFYLLFRQRLDTHVHFKNLTDNDKDTIIGLAEKYVMICCYRNLFCPATTTDEEKDLELQNRIRRLNWISTKELYCTINERSQVVRDLLHESIDEILGMDGRMAPQDKMECLVKCCKAIFEMLSISNDGKPASADEFLPCLIYVCLKANPPRIQSNINFVTRFCNEDKLRMGEAGYFFANFCCALSFIETMSAESVNMDPEEFDAYFSGRAQPPGSWQSSLLMCEGLQVMAQNLKTLQELKTRHDRVLEDTKKLQAEMKSFQEEISSEVKAVLERTQYEIRGPRKPSVTGDSATTAIHAAPTVDLDALENPADVDLPSPMVPETAAAASEMSAAASVPDEDSDMVLPPEARFEVTGPVAAEAAAPVVGLEEFFGSSHASSNQDNVSLLDLSMAANQSLLGDEDALSLAMDDNDPESVDEFGSGYRGFSAQSSAIRTISCNTAMTAAGDGIASTSKPTSPAKGITEDFQDESVVAVSSEPTN